jgi:uncharacterized protein
MTTRADVNAFLACQRIAVVGVSRSKNKFGNLAYRELKSKGFRLVPVHRDAKEIEGDACVRDLASLPEPADGVLVVVPPAIANEVVREAHAAGIQRVWLQQGAQSEEAVQFCRDHDMQVVANECILMFAEPAGFLHRAHRWAANLFGRTPR